MIAADSVLESLGVMVSNTAKAFANVAFTGSLIILVLMVVAIFVYAKRRPVGTPLTWGEAMAAAVYVTFAMFWAFGVVPHQWLTYAEGDLAMRSDAILAGPGSTGLFEWLPIVISKQTLSDSVAVTLYMLAFGGAIAMWAVWQGRGDKVSDEVETSNYGRPLVKS